MSNQLGNSPFHIVHKVSTGAPAPSDTEILDALVENHGIAMRVAAKLEITEGDIYRAVSKNARALSTRLRAALMLDTFKTLIKTQTALEAALADMQPGDIGKTYAATLSAFTNLAGQFEEQEAVDTDDDTIAGKEWMLDHLDKLGKREAIESANMPNSDEVAG